MSDWLDKMGISILKNQENSQQLLEKFVETARPSSVFAPPITAGENTGRQTGGLTCTILGGLPMQYWRPPFPDPSSWSWGLQRLLRGWPNPPANQQLECHLEAARSADGRQVLVKGWAEGADTGALLWLDSSPGSRPVRLDVVPEPREDVQAHLLGVGRPATSTRHGFWTVVPLPRLGFGTIRLCRVTDRAVRWSGELTVSVERVPQPALLGYPLTAARLSGLPTTEAFLRLKQAG